MVVVVSFFAIIKERVKANARFCEDRSPPLFASYFFLREQTRENTPKI